MNDTCKYTGIDRPYSIEDLASFHGHLGPYIVLGYRIGRYAREHFCSDPFQMKAKVHCIAVPPQSCMADGIQIGSGCTLGKRNIEIIECTEILCEFVSGERKLSVRPKPIIFPPEGGHSYSQLIENLAVDMYYIPDSEIFSAKLI
ncbi:FmdE, Molybdenum formylmethanofuran dehydrogenase operon [uncultured archaeon]|nr:FmdE, Molybdenum formylmethanofuran dehydrogenase operon [uncultured archaeon]